MTDNDLVPRSRWPRRLILIALVLGVAGLITTLKNSHSLEPVKLPTLNGYDDIVQAGAMIQGTWPNKGDLQKASIDEIRPFVGANKASLDRARVGLQRESMVHMDETHKGLGDHLNEINQIRSLNRLLMGEALIFEADGQFDRSARTYGEVMELGQAVSQNGMMIDVTTGIAIQQQALTRIGNLSGRLSSIESKSLIRQLESIDQRRVTFEAVETCEDRWMQGAYPAYQRMMMRWSGVEQKSKADVRKTIVPIFDKKCRQLRFLEVQLAVHAFHADQKTRPKSVAELVPTYLPTVPLDPTSGEPLEYPANEAGELTDDLSQIARPDGVIIKPQP